MQTDAAHLFALEAYHQAERLKYKKGMADALQNMGEIARDRDDFISAENNLRKAAAMFEVLGATKEISWSYLTLGWSLYSQSKYLEARAAYEKSLPYYLNTNNKERQSMLYRLISYTYSAQGYNEKAFESMLKALRITQKISDSRGSVSSPLNTAVLYKDAGEIETALGYYRLATQNAEKSNQPVRYNKIMGVAYVLKNQFDSAIYFHKQAYHFIAMRTPDPSIRRKELAYQNVYIGEIYLRQKKYDQAITLFTKSLPFFEKGNHQVWLMKVLYDLAKAFEMQEQAQMSFLYTKRLAEIALTTGARPYIRDCYELYWKLFDRKQKTDSAYGYYQKYIAIKDSILKDQYLRNIALSEMKSNDEQQRIKINLLQKEQQIKQQQFTNQQQKLKSESLIKNVLIGSIIAMLVIVIFIVRNISLKRKNEKLQNERKHAQLKQQATQLEIKALRAQMNPHFIFNCLSSINRYILTNDTEAASDYLTKFSRLIRMALQHSEQAMITLENELEMLRLYLELERLRFKNAFNYRITLVNSIELSATFIPPLLIQPFVENAIWHGLMHKKGMGDLDIALSVEGKNLHCIITDNGIGRQTAALLKSKSAAKNKSMGIQITLDRIALLNQVNDQQTFFEIQDIIDNKGLTNGTKVVLKIKYNSLTEMYG